MSAPIAIDELHIILNSVLPEYQPISQAINGMSSFSKERQKEFDDDPESFDQWLMSERKKRYKSIDKFGNIFLIQNPFVWHSYLKLGIKTFVRPAPELKMKWDEAKRSARSSGVVNSGTQSFEV